MNQGWIKLHRQITDHWLYKEKRVFSKFEAWQDLLLHTNHAPNKFFMKGQLIALEAGQSARSQVTLSKNWKWSRKKVSNFLKLLEKDQMILLETTKNTSIITIVNWKTYQQNDQKKNNQTASKSKTYKEQGTSEAHQKNIKGTSEEHQKHINKNEKNKKNVNNEKNHHQAVKNDDDDFLSKINIEKLQKAFKTLDVLKEVELIKEKVAGQTVSVPENYVRQCLNNKIQKKKIMAADSDDYRHFDENTDYSEDIPEFAKVITF